MKLKYIITLGLIFFVSFCKKDDPLDIDYFAFGTAYGECLGNCANFFMIKDNNLYADDMDYYSGSTLKFQNEPLPVEKYNLAKQLLDDFPGYLEDNPNVSFGCPDCADQGGIHIEIKEDGVVKSWHIDTFVTNQPDKIRDYIQEMLDVLEQLK
ncbi:MAG: hypothetical protein NT092_11550 [Bacteroidia bacterium]|nr:hypothetical protein [Bacteroidia bacterium]